MKILNIDKLAKKEGREVVLFGKAHVVNGMTVENFIETTTVAEQLENEPSLVKQVQATVDMVLRSVPTVERKDLEMLELEQLQAIVSFIRGDAVDGVEVRQQDEQEGTQKK